MSRGAGAGRCVVFLAIVVAALVGCAASDLVPVTYANLSSFVEAHPEGAALVLYHSATRVSPERLSLGGPLRLARARGWPIGMTNVAEDKIIGMPRKDLASLFFTKFGHAHRPHLDEIGAQTYYQGKPVFAPLAGKWPTVEPQLVAQMERLAAGGGALPTFTTLEGVRGLAFHSPVAVVGTFFPGQDAEEARFREKMAEHMPAEHAVFGVHRTAEAVVSSDGVASTEPTVTIFYEGVPLEEMPAALVADGAIDKRLLLEPFIRNTSAAMLVSYHENTAAEWPYERGHTVFVCPRHGMGGASQALLEVAHATRDASVSFLYLSREEFTEVDKFIVRKALESSGDEAPQPLEETDQDCVVLRAPTTGAFRLRMARAESLLGWEDAAFDTYIREIAEVVRQDELKRKKHLERVLKTFHEGDLQATFQLLTREGESEDVVFHDLCYLGAQELEEGQFEALRSFIHSKEFADMRGPSVSDVNPIDEDNFESQVGEFLEGRITFTSDGDEETPVQTWLSVVMNRDRWCYLVLQAHEMIVTLGLEFLLTSPPPPCSCSLGPCTGTLARKALERNARAVQRDMAERFASLREQAGIVSGLIGDFSLTDERGLSFPEIVRELLRERRELRSWHTDVFARMALDESFERALPILDAYAAEHSHIDRIDASTLSADAFFERYGGKRPVILTGLNLTPRHNWTLEYLSKTCGHVPMTGDALQQRDPYQASWGRLQPVFPGTRPFNFSTFVDKAFTEMAAKGWYLFDFPLGLQCTDLYGRPPYDEVVIPKYFSVDFEHYAPAMGPRTSTYPTLFIGPKDTYTAVHRDSAHTPFWMWLLSGRKHWRFFDPLLHQLLYPHPTAADYRVDVFAPLNNTAFPLYRYADRLKYDVELRAGELLYIAPATPHAVQNPEDIHAISFNYVDHASFPMQVEEAVTGHYAEQNIKEAGEGDVALLFEHGFWPAYHDWKEGRLPPNEDVTFGEFQSRYRIREDDD